MKLVAILTDFGDMDPYVGVMKGVMLQICPDLAFVDITHKISSGDIEQASFQLSRSVPWFPEGTVFLVVVDPGVGGPRRPIVVKSEKHYFVAPDNGVLTFVLRNNRSIQAYEIALSKYVLPRISTTFHGRDIFAPVAAHLAKGVPLDELGTEINDLFWLDVEADKAKGEYYVARVMVVDRFGNLITDVSHDEVPFKVRQVSVGGVRIPVVTHYGSVAEGQLLALWGSDGQLEISVNKGSAASVLEAHRGTEILLLS